MMHYPTDQEELAVEKLFFTNGIGMRHHLSLDALFSLFCSLTQFRIEMITETIAKRRDFK